MLEIMTIRLESLRLRSNACYSLRLVGMELVN